MKKYLLLSLFLIATSWSLAQNRRAKSQPTPEQYTDAIVSKYTDSLAVLTDFYNHTWTYKGKDELRNPFYYRLFFTPTLYSSPIKQKMDNDWTGLYNRISRPYSLLDTRDLQLHRDSALNNMFANFYLNYPQYITMMETTVTQTEGFRKEASNTAPIKHEVTLAQQIKPVVSQEVVEPVKVTSHRPNFWKFTRHNYSLTFTQNHRSKYHASGHLDNFQAESAALYTLVYNNQKRITFNNTLDILLGFASQKGDTLRKYSPTNNRIVMGNSLLIKAIKSWNYSLSLNSRTGIWPTYPFNRRGATSDFMSPFTSNLGIGMNYNPTFKPYGAKKDKSFTFSATFSVLSYDYKFVARKNLAAHNGVKGDHHHAETFGSTVTFRGRWIPKGGAYPITWDYNIYYFSNYERIDTWMTNIIGLKLTKHLTSQFQFNPSFYDSRIKKDGKRHIEITQTLTLGFTYSFIK